MKKRIAIVVLVMCALFTLAACGSASSSPIVGTWKDEALGMVTLEFNGDGTMETTVFGQSVSGTYKTDGDKITMNVGGEEETETFKIEGNKLTLTNAQNSAVYVKQ